MAKQERQEFQRKARKVFDDGERDVAVVEVLLAPESGKFYVSIGAGRNRLFISEKMAISLYKGLPDVMKEARGGAATPKAE